MRDVLIKKIKDLSDFAESIEEHNTALVLSALCAAIPTGQDFKLAIKVQEYIKDVLLPEAKQELIKSIVSKN